MSHSGERLGVVGIGAELPKPQNAPLTLPEQPLGQQVGPGIMIGNDGVKISQLRQFAVHHDRGPRRSQLIESFACRVGIKHSPQ